MRHNLLVTGLFLILSITSCNAQKESNEGRYVFKKGSYDGIGKWYFGREIAHVMGYQGISLAREKGKRAGRKQQQTN